MDKTLRRSTFIGILFVWILGVLWHFIYDFSGQNFLVGLIAPVNESIFEHTKLIFFPVLIYYIIEYVVFKKIGIEVNYLAGIIALIMGTLLVPFIYYFVTFGFGTSSFVIDILNFFVSALVVFVFRYYLSFAVPIISKNLSIVILTILTLFMMYLTIAPPKVPFFYNSESSSYGIYNEK